MAGSWWGKAVGKYAKGEAPKLGSVLVFRAIDAMRSGHVAAVTQIVSDRIIKVTHANWPVIHGRKGKIETDVTVVDASPRNDWSAVKIWYEPVHDVNIKAYPTYGFIYGEKTRSRAAPPPKSVVAPRATDQTAAELPDRAIRFLQPTAAATASLAS